VADDPYRLVATADLSRVTSLQLLARQVVEGFTSGRHRSPHKGFSVEFKEHRAYVRGDELKNIDWQAYAKSDRLFIREFEQETSLRCTLLLDRSGSMAYRGFDESSSAKADEPLSKDEFSLRVAASLAYLMLGQQDSVGLITFDRRIRAEVPVRGRANHFSAILATLAKDSPGDETDLGEVLTQVGPRIARRSLVIVLSDALADLHSLSRSIASLRSRHHEILWLQVLHPDEVDFDFAGRVQFRDLEHPDQSQTVDATAVRKKYLKRFEDHQHELTRICRRHRVDLATMRTDDSPADALAAYLATRRRLR